MKYMNIGHSDVKASIITLGAWSIGGGSWWKNTEDELSIKTIHRALELGPGGQQDHRHVRMQRADVVEQLSAFVAAGGIGLEVHIGDHQIDIAPAQPRQPCIRAGRCRRIDAIERKQHIKRGGNGGVVIDDEDGGHGEERGLGSGGAELGSGESGLQGFHQGAQHATCSGAGLGDAGRRTAAGAVALPVHRFFQP